MNLGHCTVYSVLKGPLTSVISYSAQLTWRAHIWNSVENSLKLSKKKILGTISSNAGRRGL